MAEGKIETEVKENWEKVKEWRNDKSETIALMTKNDEEYRVRLIIKEGLIPDLEEVINEYKGLGSYEDVFYVREEGVEICGLKKAHNWNLVARDFVTEIDNLLKSNNIDFKSIY